MSLSPREHRAIQAYLVEGKSLAETCRLLNASPSRIGHVSVRRLKQILAKAGRKALFYSRFFEATQNGTKGLGRHIHGPSCLGFDSKQEEIAFMCGE